MADLKAKFEQAVKDSKGLPEKPDNMTLLKLYALYKQGSGGDVDGKRPLVLVINYNAVCLHTTPSASHTARCKALNSNITDFKIIKKIVKNITHTF